MLAFSLGGPEIFVIFLLFLVPFIIGYLLGRSSERKKIKKQNKSSIEQPTSAVTEMERLFELKTKGAVSDEEYQSLKTKLIQK